MKTISVYDYTDYRAYLQDLMEAKRNSPEGFSYLKLAQQAGFKSRSFLRTVISGKKNLSSEAITKLIIAFPLSYSEGESFRALVQYNQAKNFEEKKYYWENFLKTRPRVKGSSRVGDEYKYLARFFYPLLPILLRQPQVQKNLKNLAKLVGASESEVREGLETLASLGIAQKLDDQNYSATDIPVTTSNDVPNIAIQTFHANMLERAKSALSLNPKEREFQSQIVALSEEDVVYLKSRLRSLMEEISEKYDKANPQAKKVFALNANLIPITPEFNRAEEPASAARPNSVSLIEKQGVPYERN